MIRNLTCIECPLSCFLSVDVENCKVIQVVGNRCPKGQNYAAAEVQNPTRILTATVLCRGLSLKMLPVRTDQPVPKDRILEAMQQIRKIKVDKPVQAGEIIVKDFLNLQVNLIATRDVYSLDIAPTS